MRRPVLRFQPAAYVLFEIQPDLPQVIERKIQFTIQVQPELRFVIVAYPFCQIAVFKYIYHNGIFIPPSQLAIFHRQQREPPGRTRLVYPAVSAISRRRVFHQREIIPAVEFTAVYPLPDVFRDRIRRFAFVVRILMFCIEIFFRSVFEYHDNIFMFAVFVFTCLLHGAYVFAVELYAFSPHMV